MMYAIVKELRETNGSGVIVLVEWFEDDPGDDRDMRPFLHDQLLIPAADVASVTPEQLDSALARREAELATERDAASRGTPNSTVAAMVGQARGFRGGRAERGRR